LGELAKTALGRFMPLMYTVALVARATVNFPSENSIAVYRTVSYQHNNGQITNFNSSSSDFSMSPELLNRATVLASLGISIFIMWRSY